LVIINLFSKNKLFLLLILILLCYQSLLSWEYFNYRIKKNVMVRMSDGIYLACDLYLPVKKQKYPVIFNRTPYNKENLGSSLGKYFAQRGYAVVVQDSRGKFASEGIFLPLINDGKDAKETMDWIGKQYWCNGKVGFWGSSYSSHSGFYLGAINHPLLKTMVNVAGAGDIKPFLYPGGTLHLMATLPWALFAEGKSQQSLSDIDIDKLFSTVPLSKAISTESIKPNIWSLFTDERLNRKLKQRISIAERYGNIDIPIFHVLGWNDMMYRSSIYVHQKIKDSDEDCNNSPLQKIIIGPWHHDQQWTEETKVGDEDFGPLAKMGKERILEASEQWFDYWLKGINNKIIEEYPVKYFVMGKNEWREKTEFPPINVKKQYWYLSSKEGANSLYGDGFLSSDYDELNRKLLSESPSKDSDSFIYDPLNPVPTRGGVNFHFFKDNLGIKDQRPIEKRKDVLVFTSEPLPEDMEIIGPIKTVLYVSTEGRDTDFTAKLVEVRPDGYARIIEDGIIRLSRRNSLHKTEKVIPGKVYHISIDLGATAILIKKDHCLRLEVSSSNFPKYSRNPNTAEDPLKARIFKKVRQTVYHNKKYPSCVVLPILKGK